MDLDELIKRVTLEVCAKIEQEKSAPAFSGQITPQATARYIDHTLLKPEASIEQVKKVCDEAKQYKFASVCVNPSYIRYVAEQLRASGVTPCVVIGFPLGSSSPDIKAQETESVISYGAKEVDMVVNIGAIKSNNWKLVVDDISAVVKACRGRAILKVIIETCLLTDEEKVKVCSIAKEVGADFVKTSTGFSTDGATIEDVALMRKTVGPNVGVKASGGVKNYGDAVAMINAGATRLGTSSGVSIVSGQIEENNCVNCGICQGVCPTGNVTINKNSY